MSGQLKRIILDDQNHDDLVGGGDIGVGPWQNFVPDPGWGTGTLRYRLVPAGLQFDGAQVGSNGADANIVSLGFLAPAYTPARQTLLMMTVLGSGTNNYGFGFLVFQVNGQVAVWYSLAGNQFVVNGLVALD